MDARFIFFLVALTIMAIVAAYQYWFSEAAKVRRALKSAPRMRIAQAPQGSVVKIAGRVRPVGPLLRAPISGRPCVYFEVIVEQYRSSGRSGYWERLIRETDVRDFLLEDGSGRALVQTIDMRVVAVYDNERRSGFMNDASPELKAFLASHGQSSEGILFNKTLRYKEAVFEPNETVSALGVARWEHDPDPTEAGTGYRDMPKRLVIESRPEGPVLASDEPGTVS